MEIVRWEDDSSSLFEKFPEKNRAGLLCCLPLIACSIQLAVMQAPFLM